MQNNLEIGEHIRGIRENLHMSREKFSEMIDISDVFLGQIERGERFLSIKTLTKIVDFTGASTDYILFGDSKNNKTYDKINRILNKCSEEGLLFIYEIIRCSSTFLKGINKSL